MTWLPTLEWIVDKCAECPWFEENADRCTVLDVEVNAEEVPLPRCPLRRFVHVFRLKEGV